LLYIEAAEELAQHYEYHNNYRHSSRFLKIVLKTKAAWMRRYRYDETDQDRNVYFGIVSPDAGLGS
jgi:hypothetical protein